MLGVAASQWIHFSEKKSGGVGEGAAAKVRCPDFRPQ